MQKNGIEIKLIAVMLIIALTISYFTIVGEAIVSYAATLALDEQNEATNNNNVKFNTFFNKDNEKTHYLICDVNEENSSMQIELSVAEGYLKDAVVSFDESKNYIIKGLRDEAGMVQGTEANKIMLKQINSNTQVTLGLAISTKLADKVKLEQLNKDSKVKLTGKYVNKEGKEIAIEKEITLNVGWTGEYETKLEQTLQKYFTYTVNGEKKSLIELSAKVGLQDKENKLPIKETTLILTVPEFNGVKPEKVIAYPKNTIGTNGIAEEQIEFNSENIVYDTEKGTLTIKTPNNENNNEVWAGKGIDEYIITYIYPQISSEQITLASKLESNIIVYSNNTTQEIKETVQNDIILKNEFGNTVSGYMNFNNKEINKGRIYANTTMAEKSYETEYQTRWQINVGYKDLSEKIRIADYSEYFLGKNSGKHSSLTVNEIDYTYYKQTVISKTNFEQLLGEAGEIKISDNAGNLITTINKDTKVDENNNYVVKYTNPVSKIVIETSKPVAEGVLCVNSTKAIKADLPYPKDEMIDFGKLVSEMIVSQKEFNSENYIEIEKTAAQLILTETNTNANLVIGKQSLSTIVKNENVELKIELDNTRENSDLYVNPIFRIEFPDYVQDVEIKDKNILYNEGLQIKNIEKLDNNGKIVLQIEIEGSQNGFSTGSLTNGTNIVLNTDITVKLLTPSKKDKITLTYINQNALTYSNRIEEEGIASQSEENIGQTEAEVDFNAPIGMLSVNSMTNFDDTGKKIISINQGTITQKIGIFEPEKIAKMELIVVNNTGNVCNNMISIGRVPFKGNKNIEETEELGTTIDAVLQGAIVPDETLKDIAEIYYSENGEATTDLNNTANGWTKTIADYSKIKSYMIIWKDYECQPGDMLSLSYEFKVPGNLEHNNNLYGAFGTYYTNNSSVGAKDEVSVADIVGLTTGQGPQLKLEQAISVGEGNAIQEGQIIKYTIRVTNTGKNEAENVYVKDLLPEYTQYTEYKEPDRVTEELLGGYIYPETKVDSDTKQKYIDWNLGTIAPGVTIEKEFLLKVNNLPTITEYYGSNEGFTKDIDTGKYYIVTYDEEGALVSKEEITGLPEIKAFNTVVVTAKDLEKAMTATNSGNKIEEVYLELSEKSSINSKVVIDEGKELVYTINLANRKEYTLENVKAEKILPNGLDYKSAYLMTYNTNKQEWTKSGEAVYNSETRKIIWNIGTMAANESIVLKVEVVSSTLENNVYEKIVKTNTVAFADGINNHSSTEVTNIIAKPYLEVEQTTDVTQEYVSEGDQVIYTIKVRNKGKIAANNMKIQDAIPEEFQVVAANYRIGTISSTASVSASGEVTLFANLLVGEELVLQITTKAKELPNDVDEKATVNYATISGNNIADIRTNEITKTVEQSNEPNKPENPDKTPNTPDIPNGGNNGDNSGDNNNPGQEIKTYKIKGLAWVDENENGARESTEKLMPGIKVTLVNAKTGDIIIDRTTGEAKETVTAQDGTYTFDNLIKGEYIVVFYYDNKVYGLTDYNKTGVSESINSDVIASKITDNGQQIDAAVTNTIKITENSYANIDIGLVVNNKFDLKLDKLVSKITVQNKDGVKTYDYTETTLAKVEIKAKRLNGSLVVIEYTMRITNEGNVPGYVKTISDSIPSDLKFNSDLNANWYLGNDGKLYNSELGEEIINPGETKEVKLVLTKQMTDTNVGVSNNIAEIYESYNDLGIKDIDSIAGNEAQGEDDMGTANVLITVGTGAPVVYTCITLISLIILASGIYIIKRKTARYYN